MKKIVLAAFAAAVAFPAAAAPGDTATANGTATAEIVAPITITHTGTALNFGIIAADTAGTIVVATDGTNSETGGASLVPTSTPTTADAFEVSGQSGLAYSLDFGAGTVTLSGSGTAAGDSMTANLNPSSTGGTLGAGPDTFTVGGELFVDAGQLAGPYSGTYTVIAAYE